MDTGLYRETKEVVNIGARGGGETEQGPFKHQVRYRFLIMLNKKSWLLQA